MRRLLHLIGAATLAAALSGCVVPGAEVPAAARPGFRGPVVPPPTAPVARTFGEVVAYVEPVAEAICRERTRNVPCDFDIVIDNRPGQPPNAGQTIDRATGRPVILFTQALIADARNADEIAFVLGHEAAHHIAGHIPRQQQTAMAGALALGVLAAMGGADDAAVRQAQDFGAFVGARSYSKDLELEADALGTEIALRAGFDPERGAAFFTRLPDPGDQFLGSHPPNAQRIQTVRATLATLR